MGLYNPLIIDALIRERIYRPLTGDVVLIGRQTVYYTPAKILALLRAHGADVQGVAERDIEIDRSTLNRVEGYAGAELISDTAFFRLLGASKVIALDHSDYEGAEIIHDLTRPIPPKLKNCADVIIDGSTLDNVFDPAMVIRNFAEMLRPGGRLMMANMFSNHYEPYAIMPPLWYLDFFVVNGFADCKLYIQVCTEPYNTFTIDFDALLDPERKVSPFASPYEMSVIVLAEKAAGSTSHVNPAQQHYRSQEQWAQYRTNLERMNSSQRPHLCHSEGDIIFFDVRAGHLFMDIDYRALDPMTEIRRLHPEYR